MLKRQSERPFKDQVSRICTAITISLS